MGKPDIRVETPLVWNEYKEKTIDQALPSIYGQACQTSTRFAQWYWSSIKTKRQTSLAVRFGTLLLLILGTLSPILAGLRVDAADKLQLTQLGVCALALGGLLQVADRVFGWSSGWIRYITTATAMENLARKFELDWAAYILDKGGALTSVDIKPLFDIAGKLQESLMKLQSDETEKWQTEFSSGAALLGDLIKSQRESGEKAVEAATAVLAAQKTLVEANAKAKVLGAVEVSLVHKGDPTPVVILFDERERETYRGTVWSRVNVSPGQHVLTVESDEQPPVVVKRVVEVPAGGVARVEVKLGP
jgi:hypothetical protein